MASSHNFERVYGPDSLKVMTTAFDYAHKSFPLSPLLLILPTSTETRSSSPSAVLDFLR